MLHKEKEAPLVGSESKKNLILIASLVLIWGLCWPIYKVALAYTPPLLFAGMRTFFGGLLVTLVILKQWKKIKWRENWMIYCISAFFNTFLFYGLQSIGLLFMPGGLFAVLVYFQPVLIGLFGWMWLGERMNSVKMGGLLIGFLGVAAVSANSVTGDISLIGVVMALLTGISWALGVVYVKKVGNKVDSLWLVAMQCVIGGFFLMVLGIGLEEMSSIVWNGPFLFGLAFGSILGVPAAFLIYYKLVNQGEASKVASTTFLVPLLSVLIGTVFLGEPFSYSLCLGLFLIVFSIYFVNRPVKKSEKDAMHHV